MSGGAALLIAAAAVTVPAALQAQAGSPASTAEPANASEYLEHGEYVRGEIKTTGQTDCYLFETKPGQKLLVAVTPTAPFDSILTIGAGTQCDGSMRIYGRNDNFEGQQSILTFAAGGGTYIAQVSGARRTTGAYGIHVTGFDLASRKYAPGLPIARVVQPQFADGISASTAPPSGTPAPQPGTVIKDCAECPELVVVKAGSFFMGSTSEEEGHQSNEGPRHLVKIARPFAIGKYEVTFSEWEACYRDNGCGFVPHDEGWGRGRRPVISISWLDALRYVRWLRRKTGQNYYLPSEAEWEYSTRAGTTTPWNTGSALITDDANILNSLGRTVPVGGYPANAFGLHDTHGNVAEWTADCFEIGYFGTPKDGSAMTADECKERVARGDGFADAPHNQRSAQRHHAAPHLGSVGLGFRVARAL